MRRRARTPAPFRCLPRPRRHGAGHAGLTHLDAVADEHGFLVVYPQGVSQSWADGRGATAADQAGVDDVAFVRHLLDHLESTYRVDPRRVFVTGISNGAFMAHRLAATAGRTRRLDLPDGRRRN